MDKTPCANFEFASPPCQGSLPKGAGQNTSEITIKCLVSFTHEAETKMFTFLKKDHQRDYGCISIMTEIWQSSWDSLVRWQGWSKTGGERGSGQSTSQCKTTNYYAISGLSRQCRPRRWPSCKIMKSESLNRLFLTGSGLGFSGNPAMISVTTKRGYLDLVNPGNPFGAEGGIWTRRTGMTSSDKQWPVVI